MSTTAVPTAKLTCEFCGREAAPGPMVNHKKTCSMNPEATGYHVHQPTATCRYCGLTSTAGPIGVHERYGCPNRPPDIEGPGIGTCPHCGLTTTGGALAVHVRACPEDPARKVAHAVES